MQKIFSTPALLAMCLAASGIPSWGADDDVVAAPLSMVTQVDGGQVIHGHSGETNDGDISKEFIQRTSVWITQKVLIGQRLDVNAGIGGLFWYSSPGPHPSDGVSSTTPFSALTKFGPGISRADMTYRFGDASAPRFTLQAGFFPYKYNPDARDLGEYLLRSGTYPGYLVSGGWNLISEAGYMMQGFRLNMSLWGGKFQSEFLLPMEHDFQPMNDFSPTYIGTVAPVKGLEVGGGVSCSHCIAVRPSETSPKDDYTGTTTAETGNGNSYIIRNPNYIASPGDSLKTDLTGSNPKYIYDTSGNYYTFQGVKLMGRFSFDPKAYLDLPMLGASDLKIFGEVALLGVKNYPFYYEDRLRRMPVMFGINLPTFHLLDILSFQMEYYNSKFPNSIRDVYKFGMPTYDFVDAAGNKTDDPNTFDPTNEVVSRDNWKWALYARKEFVKGLRVYVQVADDHLRVPDFYVVTSSRPITNVQGRDWYYLIRFELGI